VTPSERATSLGVGRLAIVSILAAVALAVMLPRLLSPHFGLLDDGVTIYVSRAFGVALDEGVPGLLLRLELERGRFRPLYWLFEALQYALWGPSARGFFIGNSLALLLTALCVSGTVAAISRDRLACLLAGVAYVLSPPVFESYYTLSKPEVPLALWLAVSLCCWAGARVESERRPQRSRRLFAASGASLFLAYFTKETAQAMVLVSALWMIAPWMTSRITRSAGAARVDRWYVGVNLAWTALFWIVRTGSGTASIAAGGDSQRYAVTGLSMLSSGLGHLVWYSRDFPLLLPFVAFLSWGAVRRARPDPWLVLVPVCWILGWTAVMLPWPTIFEYFLLPASLAVSIVTGIGVAEALRGVRAPQTSVRAAAVVLVTLTAVCMPLTLANAVTNGRIQLAVDAANAHLVDFLATTSPPGGTVLVHIPSPNEYVEELAVHLAVLRARADLRVRYSDRHVVRGDEAALIARPHMRNRPRPGVRLPVPESPSAPSRDEVRARFGRRAVLVYRVTRRVRLLVTSVPPPVCRVLVRAEAYAGLFCGAYRRFFDRRTFEYGWEVHRVDAS
jgi:hypothetical protein